MARRSATAGMVVVAVVSLALTAGCGSGSNASGSSGGGGGSGSGAGSSGADVAGAQAVVDKYLEPPTSIGDLPPLTQKPPSGKRMIITETPEPVTIKVNDAMAAAAQAVGWTVSRLEIGTGAEDPAKALNAALDQKPDLVVQTGAPASQLRQPLERAKAEHIVVLRSDNSDQVGVDGTIVNTGIDGPSQTGLYGKLAADYTVAKSNGNVNALVVNFPTYPILTAFADGYDQELKAKCPSCSTTRLDQQVSDLAGGKLPGAVVSALQRDPKINWVVLSLGDATLGLKAALRAAGLADKVQIGGESAGTQNITALKKGDEQMWTGFAAAILGWRRVDAAIRYLNGDTAGLQKVSQVPLPSQLLTPKNVDSAPLDAQGYYIGVKDYEAQFKKLWGLG